MTDSNKVKKDAKRKAKLHKEESSKKHSESRVQNMTRGDGGNDALKKGTSILNPHKIDKVQVEGDEEHGKEKEKRQEESAWKKAKASKFSKELKKLAQGKVA
eukprot:Gb_30578 [translate_table: standard]